MKARPRIETDIGDLLYGGALDMETALSLAALCEKVEAAVKAGGVSQEALQQLIATFDMATRTCLEVANGEEWE